LLAAAPSLLEGSRLHALFAEDALEQRPDDPCEILQVVQDESPSPGTAPAARPLSHRGFSFATISESGTHGRPHT
jgi:hypothetical protein